MQMQWVSFVICFLSLSFIIPVQHAVAGLHSDHDVYSFLHRAWLYGCTLRPAPTVRPETLPELLLRLQECDQNREKLPAAEQAELDELLNEIAVYTGNKDLHLSSTRWSGLISESSPLFKRGSHLYGMREGDLAFTIDPVIAWQGIYDEDYGDDPLLRSVIGVEVTAMLGEHWSAGVRFTDTAEYNQDENAGAYTPDAGYVASVSPAGGSASFDETLAYIEYHHQFVDLGIGRDRMSRGPSLDHGLILSGKAPAYLYLQLRARVRPWVTFDYFHARLDPAPVEEEVYYISPSGKQRKVVNQKWLAVHRLEINPTWWLQFGLTETVIYAERDAELGYLIPLNLFWSENHHQDRDDNIAWGIDLRVQALEGVSVFAEYLLDETSLSGILGSDLHNRTAFSLGMDIIKPLGLRGSLLQLHLTRLRPYVYSHWFAVSVHAHNGTALGSSIPPNSEAISLCFSQRFGGVWEVTALGQHLRHGETPAGGDEVGGNIHELVPVGQRNVSYPLLSGERISALRGEVSVAWEPLENFELSAKLGLTRIEGETFTLFLAGFAYNL